VLPLELKDFLVATATASASFIGLLFVAISVIDSSKISAAEFRTKRILAESSYTALISIFFISLVGLIPHASIGWVTLVMAWAGLSNVRHLQQQRGEQDRYNRTLFGLSAVVYIGQVIYGVVLIFDRNHIVNQYYFMTLLFLLFGVALGRAWALTGIRQP